jgi:hypothetical protein
MVALRCDTWGVTDGTRGVEDIRDEIVAAIQASDASTWQRPEAGGGVSEVPMIGLVKVIAARFVGRSTARHD